MRPNGRLYRRRIVRLICVRRHYLCPSLYNLKNAGTMNGLLSDITKDLIAIVGFVLAVLQTVVLLVQLWRSRQASQSANPASSPPKGFRLSVVTSNINVLGSVAIIATGFFLSLIAITTLYLRGLSATTVAGASWLNGAFLWESGFLWDHPALMLLVPGSFLQGLGVPLFFFALADALKGASRRLAVALVFCSACLSGGYVILIVQALHSIHSRWFDLFIMSQTYALVFLVIGIFVKIVLLLSPDDD
jgi:hypothetical protein